MKMDKEKMDVAMRQMGKMHIGLCKIPIIGEPIARAFSHLFGLLPVYGPSPMGKSDSIIKTQAMMQAAGEEMGFPFEFSAVTEDEFTLELPYCPYGFNNAAHQRPCDTAMDMDRFMLKLCGAELTIDATIPQGADRCKMRIRQIRKPKIIASSSEN